jgi:clan AA aspartic protease (TIGR02281 family)
MRLIFLIFSFLPGVFFPTLAIANDLDDRIAHLRSTLSRNCLQNVFACTPQESALFHELRDLIALQSRIERHANYLVLSEDADFGPEILEALCDGYTKSSDDRAINCAREWSVYLAKQLEDSDETVEDIIRRALDNQDAEDILISARDRRVTYWDDFLSELGTQRVERSQDGHFWSMVSLDGSEVSMMIDTGASTVVLSHADARTVGIQTEILEYEIPFETASGVEYFAPETIRNLQFAGESFQNVNVVVAPRGAGGTSLLGMSLLKQFSEIQINQNELLLTR